LIKDFLKNLQKSKIAKILNLKDEEILVLKLMLEYYIDGVEDIKVKKVLSECFNIDGVDQLDKIDIIKNLLQEGWIVLSMQKLSDLTTLELLNSNISLSIAFLKLLDKGELDFTKPKTSAYIDHLEYLHDQFMRIEIYEQLANLKVGYSNSSASIKRLQSKLKLIENTIKQRVKKTKIELPVLNFIVEEELNEKEEIIFLALLKEEYKGDGENRREMNYLLDLISNDELERIKNRSLLDENSKLVSNGIIDYDEIFGGFSGYTRIYFINEEILNELIHPKRRHKIEHYIKNSIFDLVEPKVSLDDIVLPKETMDLLKRVLKQIDKKVFALLKKWGIKDSNELEAKILFYGPPGTGKTISAHGIAKELNKPIISIDASKILSMYVGESEKNVRRIFDEYYQIQEKIKQKPILLLNEADQFFSPRSEMSLSSADKMHNQMQNIFLEQLEKFDGILIATTNFIENIDKAFSRRFDYKIKFLRPSLNERIKLWRLKLPKNAEYEKNFKIKELAKYDLTGAQIELVVKNTALKVALKDDNIFTLKDFIEEIEKELKGAFDKKSEVGFKGY